MIRKTFFKRTTALFLSLSMLVAVTYPQLLTDMIVKAVQTDDNVDSEPMTSDIQDDNTGIAVMAADTCTFGNDFDYNCNTFIIENHQQFINFLRIIDGYRLDDFDENSVVGPYDFKDKTVVCGSSNLYDYNDVANRLDEHTGVFRGTFNGLYNGSWCDIGLGFNDESIFARTEDAHILNINIQDGRLVSTAVRSTIENCSDNSSKHNGLIESATDTTVKNCYVNRRYLIGEASGTINIQHCGAIDGSLIYSTKNGANITVSNSYAYVYYKYSGFEQTGHIVYQVGVSDDISVSRCISTYGDVHGSGYHVSCDGYWYAWKDVNAAYCNQCSENNVYAGCYDGIFGTTVYQSPRDMTNFTPPIHKEHRINFMRYQADSTALAISNKILIKTRSGIVESDLVLSAGANSDWLCQGAVDPDYCYTGVRLSDTFYGDITGQIAQLYVKRSSGTSSDLLLSVSVSDANAISLCTELDGEYVEIVTAEDLAYDNSLCARPVYLVINIAEPEAASFVHFPEYTAVSYDMSEFYDNITEQGGATNAYATDIIDTIAVENVIVYENLTAGTEYLLNWNIDGNTVSQTFVPEEPNGQICLSAVLNAKDITENTSYNTTTSLFVNNGQFCMECEGNTVNVWCPQISVTRTEIRDPHKNVTSDIIATVDDAWWHVEDTVAYSGLNIFDTYFVKTALIRDGEEINVHFMPFASLLGDEKIDDNLYIREGLRSGNATIWAEDITETSDITVHIAVTVGYDGIEIFADDSYDFMFYRPTFETDARIVSYKPTLGTDVRIDGEKEVYTDGIRYIGDMISFKDLAPNRSYVVTGTVIDMETGKPFFTDGSMAKTFFRTTDSGIQDVQLGSFPNLDLSGITDTTKLMIQEKLYLTSTIKDENLIIEHTSVHDLSSTVTICCPSMATQMQEQEFIRNENNANTGISVSGDTAPVDVIGGKDYKLVTTLTDKSTGDLFCDPIITVFDAYDTQGMNFVVPGVDISEISENTKLLVSNELYYINDDGDEVLLIQDSGSETDRTVEIHVATLSTRADVNGQKEIFVSDSVVINDEVTYSDLIPNRKYTVTGFLMNRSGNLLTVNNKPVSSSVEFVPSESNGSETVTFTFDNNPFAGTEYLVVYESLQDADGYEIASHKDLNDVNQQITIYKPSITTSASVNGEKDADAVGTVTIEDIVSYNDLIAGKEYVIEGILMDKSTGMPFTVNGEQVTAAKTFTAETSNGSIPVEFAFDADYVTKHTDVVVYEYLYINGAKIASHEDIDDEAQTITIHKPSIDTIVSERELIGVGAVTIVDTVTGYDLIADKDYIVRGKLVNKATGEAFTLNGQEVTAYCSIMNGNTAQLIFTFDGSVITENTELVVSEVLYFEDTVIATNDSVPAENKTVMIYRPVISAEVAANGEKDCIASGVITIDDEISYRNLIAGQEYTAIATLINSETGDVFTINDEPVTASVQFVPENNDGTVTLQLSFDSSAVTEHVKFAVSSALYRNGMKIAECEDAGDIDSVIDIYKPVIDTTAVINGEKSAFAIGTITVTDIVKYYDLIVGKEYVIDGVLMDKETGEPLLVNGVPVISQEIFTAETTDGEVIVEFVFDAGGITGNKSVVVFETLSLNGVDIVNHADIDDVDQTVDLKKPIVSAEAVINDRKEIFVNDDMTIKVVIDYQNLIIGKEYTVSCVLVNPATGDRFSINGKEVTVEQIFISESENGSIEIYLDIDRSAVLANTKLVALETLSCGDVDFAKFSNINDADRTVEIHVPSITTQAVSNGEKEIIAVGEISIDDIVTYKDLIVGETYIIKGILMDQATGEAFLVNGEPVTAEIEFIAETSDGTVIVTFVFDSAFITENTKLVVFETLYHNEHDISVIALHTDIADSDQTVESHKPEIYATASPDSEQNVSESGTVTIESIVEYHDLFTDKEYVIDGVLIDNKTGEPLLIDGKPVTAQVKFVPETSDGKIIVVFTFDASEFTENVIIIISETLSLDGTNIATAVTEEEWSVNVKTPPVETDPSVTKPEPPVTVPDETDPPVVEPSYPGIQPGKDKPVIKNDNGDIVITFTVSYEDLIPGCPYTIEGVLVDKLKEELFMINGESFIQTKDFVPDSSDGEISLTFRIKSEYVTSETDIVMFASLYCHGEKIAEYADLDSDWSVKISANQNSNDKDNALATGVMINMGLVSIFAGSAVIVVLCKRRREQ